MRVDLSKIYAVVNKKYGPYLDDYRRIQVFKGGAGAGKSVFVAQKIVYNMILKKGYNVMALRKTGRDNHNSTFAEIKKCIGAWDMEDIFKIKSAHGLEEIICKANNNKAVFRGLDDVNKVKSVTFETGDLVCIWVEEADETEEEDYRQLNLRLRGVGDIPKHIVLSFNPVDVDCWIKKEFFDSPLDPERGFICQSTYTDNEFLDDIYKDELLKLKDIDYYYYSVYVQNQWGARTTATVFHNLKIYDFEVEEHHYQNIRHGIDFGYNHANAFMGCGYKDGELYIFRELYGKQQLNKDFIASAEQSDFEKDYCITADSAEPDKIKEWRNAGFLVYSSKKGPGSLMRGIDYLKSLPCIHIHKSLCPNAAREFPRIKYKQLRDGTILDEIMELNDDTVAAIRYANEEFFLGGGDGDFAIIKKLRN